MMNINRMSGYDTQFTGEFRLNKELSPELYKYLRFFSAQKRVKWDNLPEEFGTDGEYYYEGMDDYVSEYMFGKKISECSPVKVASVGSPGTQPNSWCNWTPTRDRIRIVWNGRKNFNDYVNWLRYIIENFLVDRDYILKGEVYYCGDCTLDYIRSDIGENVSEDSASDDYGYITVEYNVVSYTGPVGIWGEHFVEFFDDDEHTNNIKNVLLAVVIPLVALSGLCVFLILYGDVK